MRTFITGLYLFIISASALAHYQVEQLSVPEGGIPLDLVYTMMQDSRGYIWFGTMYGLVRYDGRDYKSYRHDPDNRNSISYDDIVALHEDRNGIIWIGTWGGGLNKYDPVNNLFYRINNPELFIVWDIQEDRSGNIWLAVQNGGAVEYTSTGEFRRYKGNKVNKIFISPSDDILFCTNSGIYKPEESGKVIRDEHFSEINNRIIHCIEINRYNQYWIGTDNGVYVFNNKSFIKHIEKGLSSKVVHEIICDRKNNIWIGTGYGVNKIENESLMTIPTPGSGSISVHDMILDASGILWISEYNSGVSKVKDGNNFFNSVQIPGIVSASEGSNSDIWLANNKGEILLFNSSDKSTKLIFNTDKRINSLQYKKGFIWFSTHEGLFRFKPSGEKNELLLTKGSFNKIYHDGRNVLLGSPGRGLLMYSESDNTLKSLSSDTIVFSNHFTRVVLSFYKDSKQRLWVGTYGGLIQLNSNYKPVKRYMYNEQKKNSLSNNYVYAIHEANNDIWIGTGNGLNRFRESDQSFLRYYEKDGLPNGVINGISHDNSGNLWVVTNKGVSSFDVTKNTFRNFDTRDGLLSNIFRLDGIMTDVNGSVYLNSNEGISYFEPHKIKFSDYQSRIVLSSITSSDKELFPKNKTITLASGQNSLRIKFASLDFNNPLKHQYRYIMENLDETWTDGRNENFAYYTNIPSGDYVFRVKGTNSDGIWSKYEASIAIIVPPPFYRTWWFLLICFLTIVLTSAFLINLRIKQQLKFALSVESARAEESEKIRMKTAMDFHDELGHHLTRISLLAGLIKSKGSAYSENMKLPDKIIENANILYAGTKDFIWAIDPRNDSLYEVLIRLKDFGDDLYSKTDICFEILGLDESYKEINLAMELRRNVILIFKEAMNNSLKYASSNRIVLESSLSNNDLLISLQDFGIGFKELKNTNGLSNMMKRAEKVSSTLEINSIPDRGTRITFRTEIGGRNLKD